MLEAVNRCGGNPPAFCAGFYQGGTAMAGVLMTLGGAHCNCAPPFFRTSLPRFHRPGEGIGEFPVNSLPRLDFSLARLGNPCYNDTTQHIERLDVLLFRSVERNSKTERIDTMSASREKKQRRGSSSGKSLQLSQEQAAYQRKVRTYTAIGVVTVVLVAALLIWNSGFFQSRAIAAKVGDTELSVTELSYYYNDARYIYAQYVLDSSKSDAEQMYNEEEGITYRDYFLEQALENAQRDQALYAAAIEAGHSLDEVQEQLSEQIAAMNNELAKMATDRGMYYIDTHEPLADNADFLNPEYAGGDGLHMRSGDAYRVWVEYLARHTVNNRISRNFQTTNEGFAAEMDAIFNPPAAPQA